MELWAITCVLLIIAFSDQADGLYCYQCGSTGSEGHCKSDIKGLVKSGRKVMTAINSSSADDVTDGKDDTWSEGEYLPYIKECDTGRNACIIEEVVNSQTDATLSYIRDCSDGKTFSFDNASVLRNLNRENYTTCGYDTKGYLFCVSLCTDNFCNGPFATASMSELSLFLLGYCILLRYLSLD